jgi:hypothetical protein
MSDNDLLHCEPLNHYMDRLCSNGECIRLGEGILVAAVCQSDDRSYSPQLLK